MTQGEGTGLGAGGSASLNGRSRRARARDNPVMVSEAQQDKAGGPVWQQSGIACE